MGEIRTCAVKRNVIRSSDTELFVRDGRLEETRRFFTALEWASMSKFDKESFVKIMDDILEMKRAGLSLKLLAKFIIGLDDALSEIQPEAQGLEPRTNQTKKCYRNRLTDNPDGYCIPGGESRRAKPTATSPRFNPRPPTPPPPPAPPPPTPPPPASQERSRIKVKRPKRPSASPANTGPASGVDSDLECGGCDGDWGGIDCPLHGPLHVIADATVAWDVERPDRAIRTAPPQLEVLPSKIEGAGLGVWTKEAVPARARFGPYDGVVMPAGVETGYCWQIWEGDVVVHSVDASDPASSNWMRYVNCARHAAEQNLHAFQRDGRVYYRTLRAVPPRTELLVWYGDSYAAELGIDPDAYKEPAEDPPRPPTGAFPCGACGRCFTSALMLERHSRRRCAARPRRRRSSSSSLRASGTGTPPNDATADASGYSPADASGAGAMALSANVSADASGCSQADASGYSLTDASGAASAKAFRCATCGAAFSALAGVKRHVRRHIGERPFACDDCGAAFSVEASLREHRLQHADDGTGAVALPYRCDCCDAAYSRSSLLRAHKQSHVVQNSPTCRAVFDSPHELQLHERLMHPGERCYSCEACGKDFRCSSNYCCRQRRLHATGAAMTPPPPRVDKRLSLSHPTPPPEERLFACGVCGQDFQHAEHLRAHVKMHLQVVDGRFETPPAGRREYQDHQGESQEVSVGGEGEFDVDPGEPHVGQGESFCGWSESFDGRGESHGDVGESCGDREAGVANRPVLEEPLPKRARSEERFARPMEPPSKKRLLDRFLLSEDLHRCGVCGAAFLRKRELRAHADAHTAEGGRFSCDGCQAAFVRKADLRAHRKTHRGGDSGEALSAELTFSCDICGTAFRKWRKLERHIRRAHLSEEEEECFSTTSACA